jgi:ABC-type branched-subunit amino acid transport system substrate-binding protein
MVRISLICMVLIALIAGCAPAQVAKPAVVDEKPAHIMIVYNSDISGPYAAIAGPGLAAWADATDYINNELGGLYGVPWKTTLMDTKAKVDACVGNLPKIMEMKPKPIGMSVSTGAECEALLPLTREAELPTMTSQTVGSLYPVGYQFSVYALYPDTFGYFIDWVVKNWKGTDKPKVALLDWDNPTGRGFYTDEAVAYAKERGVDVVARELFPATAVDVTTQLTRIDNAKADFIFSGTLVNGSYAVASTAYKMGMKIPIVFPMNTSLDLPIIKMNPAAAEGTYFVGGGWPVTDYSNPGIKKAREYWDKNKRPDKDWCSAIILNGWCVNMKFY